MLNYRKLLLILAIAVAATIAAIKFPTPADSFTPSAFTSKQVSEVKGDVTIKPVMNADGATDRVNFIVKDTNVAIIEVTPVHCDGRDSSIVANLYTLVNEKLKNRENETVEDYVATPYGAKAVRVALKKADGSTEVTTFDVATKCRKNEPYRGGVKEIALGKLTLEADIKPSKGVVGSAITAVGTNADSMVYTVTDCKGKKHTAMASRVSFGPGGSYVYGSGNNLVVDIKHGKYKKIDALFTKTGFDAGAVSKSYPNGCK